MPDADKVRSREHSRAGVLADEREPAPASVSRPRRAGPGQAGARRAHAAAAGVRRRGVGSEPGGGAAGAAGGAAGGGPVFAGLSPNAGRHGGALAVYATRRASLRTAPGLRSPVLRPCPDRGTGGAPEALWTPEFRLLLSAKCR